VGKAITAEHISTTYTARFYKNMQTTFVAVDIAVCFINVPRGNE